MLIEREQRNSWMSTTCKQTEQWMQEYASVYFSPSRFVMLATLFVFLQTVDDCCWVASIARPPHYFSCSLSLSLSLSLFICVTHTFQDDRQEKKKEQRVNYLFFGEKTIG
jgi:hypothetical protein